MDNAFPVTLIKQVGPLVGGGPKKKAVQQYLAMGQNRMGTFSVGSLTTSLKGWLRVTGGLRGFDP